MFDRQQHALATVDPDLWAAIEAENRRQEDQFELIASENCSSPAVMEAQGSQLTNKYAEGYPGKRYYGGCEHVDVVEQLAIDRCRELFGAGYANVQPNSGSQANQAVFFGLLQPGDTIMGMSLAEGGHLTHGMALNMSGKWFKVVSYGLDADEAIDYDAMERLAHEHKPRLIIAGASAYSLRIDFERFARVARAVGAALAAERASQAAQGVPAERGGVARQGGQLALEPFGQVRPEPGMGLELEGMRRLVQSDPGPERPKRHVQGAGGLADILLDEQEPARRRFGGQEGQVVLAQDALAEEAEQVADLASGEVPVRDRQHGFRQATADRHDLVQRRDRMARTQVARILRVVIEVAIRQQPVLVADQAPREILFE